MNQTSVKCCFVGDFGSGKTSIAYAWLDKNKTRTQATLGIDFFSKTYSTSHESYHIKIWDTAGSERFHSLTQTYLRNSDIVIVVYDLTSKQSNLVKWMQMVEQVNPKVVGVLGNKVDLVRVNTENIDDILYPWKRQPMTIIHAEITSKNKVACKQFLKLCLMALPRKVKIERPLLTPVHILPKKPKNHMCCT